MKRATAVAHPNIALVKYWGKRDVALNLPSTSSLSLTLDTFRTRTTVTWGASQDAVVVNGKPAAAKEGERVLRFLSLVDPDRPPCAVETDNNFPTAAGLASSSSGFAALALAATAAAGKRYTPAALSALARRGSGSACRSLWGGWVVWDKGVAADGGDSVSAPLAKRDHWDVRLVVALIAGGRKAVGSTEAMIRTQETSPLYPGWVESADEDLARARRAVLDRDLAALGQVMEHSALKMHGTMLAARLPIRYWKPSTLAVLDAVDELRRGGTAAFYTMDAGPNVKVLCLAADAPKVAEALRAVCGEVAVLGVGGDARLEKGR